MKTISTNILARHPSYPKILAAYNEELKVKGKVNNKKFYEEVILAEIPNYCMQSWYQFLRRFKTEYGLVAPTVRPVQGLRGKVVQKAEQNELAKTLQGNQAATASFIQSALNIGAQRARDILENPDLMTAKEAMDFAIKAMKAQDSRIHAIGKIREDNREEEKLNRAFSHEAYED